MRQGSRVHQTLEDQVHQTVEVDLQTKEDAWGLRIWNIIQGLRTLRETGLTRELEVWGVVDGLVVNGVLDELSYLCPDRELEEATSKDNTASLPADQTSITSFLGQSDNSAPTSSPGVLKNLRSLVKKTSRIYLTDVKTRGVKSIPNGASFRPTLMQLMLYHRLLSDLATNKVDQTIIFDRYGLDPSIPFSDSFIAQLSNLHDETFFDAPSDPSQQSQSLESPSPRPEQKEDTLQTLLTHNSLPTLWSLMIAEFRTTMPHGLASIGAVLKAEYRSQSDGTILGIKTFLYDDDVLSEYLEDELRWWKGEREAQGVCAEEAYKCGFCEFAEGCDWRREKIEMATEAFRKRTRSVV